MASKKIFIIDDEPSVQEYLKTILHNWGYETVGVENGLDAADKIVLENPDLILLDVMLPDIDGITLCRKFHNHPKISRIPVIMVTSLSDATTIHDALLFGARDYVTKPFDHAILKKKIEEVLGKTG